ncbi:hypothetical protein Gasu2_22600 [Galdieria sulphuraria]|nr:hypothetical protein Gasu2_22600 [Galdieria sulphuraria]
MDPFILLYQSLCQEYLSCLFMCLLEDLSFGRFQLTQNVSPDLGAVAIAYICHKALSPIRFPITVAATPFVARWWKNKTGKN